MTVASSTCGFVQTDKGDTHQLLQCLGKGGWGAVFKVRLKDGTECVLKVGEGILQEGRVQRTLTEAGVPNIVRYMGSLKLTQIEAAVHCSDFDVELHHAASQPPQDAILMELLPSKDCCDQFMIPFISDPSTRLSFEELREKIVKPALQTLKDMHERLGYVHCDIKPTNAWHCRESGQFKLFDFGDAKLERDIDPKLRDGTLCYSPPECVLHTTSNRSRDIWSLGVTIFELYTGSEAFKVPLGDDKQRANDYLFMLAENKGKFPPLELFKTSPVQHFFSIRDGKVNLKVSKECEALVAFQKHAWELYPGERLWKARIRYIAAYRAFGEGGHGVDNVDEVANAVIKLIKPMLSYKHPISAAEALRRLESPEETSEKKVANG